MNPPKNTNSNQRSPRVAFGPSLLGVFLLSWALGGCERTSLTDGMPDNAERCSSCHGTPGNPAPPYALNGGWDTKDVAVGAHQPHLIASDIAGPVLCYECHPIPTELITHPNWNVAPIAVVFGGRAILNQPAPAPGAPAWNRANASCANLYCHGATLSGAASRPPPTWTRVDGSQKSCTSCHGFPPATAAHASATTCDGCHGPVINASGKIINRERHINGITDIGGPPSAAAANARSAEVQPGGVEW